MALPATHAISSSPAAHHAHGAKAHGKSDGADSFADLLAAADAPPEDEVQAMTDVTAKAVAQGPEAQADAAQDGDEDAAIVPAENPVIPPALPQPVADPMTAQPAAKKDDGKASDAKNKPADNDTATPPQLALLLPQQQAQPLAPAAATPKNNDGIAPLATAAGQPSAGSQQQAAAASADDDGEEVAAAGAQQAATTSNPDSAKPKTPGGFKTALDDVKSATAKAASAKAADGTTPAPNAAPAHTDTHADANTDSGQADARAADAAAQPPAPANGTPQPDMLPVAAPASHGIAAQFATPIPAGQPGTPMAHHTPNMPTPNMPTPNMNGLAVDIATKSLGGAKQFDIRLDPPELGRVEVRLSIDATGNAQAHLTADQPQTLDLLQKDASTLTRALRDAGLNVNQDGLNFSLRSQQQQAGNERQHRPPGGRAVRGSFAAPASLQPVAAAAASSGRSGRGLLDIKV